MTMIALLQQASETEVPTSFMDMLGAVGTAAGIRAFVTLLVGIPLVRLAAVGVRKWATKQMNPQSGLVAGKLVFYTGLAIVAISVMRELGFSLAPLLGAAGVLGIAIGFASQTSISNVISGLFMIAERPFVLDDLIQVGDVTGRVLSIDTISVKLRTFDNRMVRIPNETLVKSQVVNITRFPIRRLDVRVGVAYKEDPERVRKVLLDIADRNPIALMEPNPVVVLEGFGDSSINFLFGVWTTQSNFLELKNGIQEEVKTRFDEEGIEIPFPHRTFYTGAETAPFPVQIVPNVGPEATGATGAAEPVEPSASA